MLRMLCTEHAVESLIGLQAHQDSNRRQCKGLSVLIITILLVYMYMCCRRVE